MLNRLTGILGGDPIGREIERYSSVVDEINNLEPSIQALSTPDLQKKTDEFRQRLLAGETVDDLLFETFAVVREASVRTIGLRHFDVQLMGGAILHTGRIAEMKTGEGKTLVATLPIYLNALAGGGVHLITVNDYLARRDARWMGPIFHFLGMSVGVLQEASRTESGRKAFLYDPEKESNQEDIHQLELVDRKDAYTADITYGTNNEFGFDYLRDNMARSLEGRSQRGHHFAILDEVDNILIDEARTPLIISGPSHEDPELYERMAKVVVKLRPEDYEINERDRTISLTEIGEDHTERLLGEPMRDPDRPEDITAHQARLLGHLEQALRAQYIFKRNKDYVVQGGKVVIVDEFTGRLMAGRRWSDGLHQAVEAKEGAKIRRENVTYATITLQNYFRMYEKLSGMTGTALTEAEEFNKIYKVDVTPLPTNLEYIAMRPESDLVEVDYQDDGSKFIFYARKEDAEHLPVFWRRKDYPDVVYRTEEAKFRALIQEILTEHVRGRPLLVGTTSVELSEQISTRLSAKSVNRQAMIMVIRNAYLEAQDLDEDGMRIDELEPLYAPLAQVGNSVMKPFARELDIPLNPGRPENLDRLLQILNLESDEREKLSQVMNAGIPHNVLNAKKHDEESRIIADAGAVGAVTIATNMAGRGVDIKLGGEIAEEVLAAVNRVLRRTGVQKPENLNMEEKLEIVETANEEQVGIYGPEIDLFKVFMADQNRVREVGGLHVIGSERHESRRIDNQLRGRAARQGDPGSSRFFLSLEDELMRLFGGTQVSGLMQRLNIDDAVPIAHGMVDRTIEQSQSRVEGAHFDTRKHLLEYDDVLNQQREIFYDQRNRVFSKDDLQDDVDEMIAFEVDRHIALSFSEEGDHWKLLAWLEETQPTLGMDSDKPYPSFMIQVILDEIESVDQPDEVKVSMLDIASNSIKANLGYILDAVEEQIVRTLEHLDEQVEQRSEMAELAIEGYLLDAEENGNAINGSDLIQAVEQAAGLNIQLDGATSRQVGDDPYEFRDRLPELIEASLGTRVWQGLIKSLETRVGEELAVEGQIELPIDWDEAEEMLLTALNDAWSARSDRLLEGIQRELDAAVPADGPVDDAAKIRMLVDMSYSQKSFFDKKTHQRRTLMVARLSYAFWVADKLAEWDIETLQNKVLHHLQEAQNTLQRSLGSAELFRLGGSILDDLDEKRQVRIRQAMGDEGYAEQSTLGPIRGLEPDAKDQISKVLGQATLTETYRGLILSVSDRMWVEYLTQMEALRTSIGLEAYGQRDPLVQYKSRAFDLFQQLLGDIRAEVVSRLYRAQPVMLAQTANADASSAGSVVASPQPPAEKSGQKKKRRRRRRR